MSSEFGNDFITIKNDDGETLELEHLETAEYRGELYMAFLPADMDEDDEDYGLIILKVIDDGNEEYFSSVDDDAELEAVHQIFMDMLSEEGEELPDDEER